ncbi:TP901-1 family phage major tail protein [Psychrobacillus insolitus]|uniref:TP901-1 family phage major tail protein n=1 Tax=Psychrobacillus insolitus TaxID=1461 RepID=A0A2W7NBR6_9BACI|nr:phage major tail protein, TP901-1 family [Psychrobacillus insolitus]PZX07899.1 TP901-1 family phage major tail protein [Psychrobacillus insolitus]
MAIKTGKDELILILPTDKTTSLVIEYDQILLAHQTSSSHAIENEISSESTKQGTVRAPGISAESFEVGGYADTENEAQKELIRATQDGVQVRIWKVNINKNAEGKHETRFGYGYLENYEESSEVEGFAEYSATAQIIGKTQTGELDALPDTVIALAKYGFEKPGEYTGDLDSKVITTFV